MNKNSKNIIEIVDLEKSYFPQSRKKHLLVFDKLNLNIHEGEFLILLGPSGCGKSTLLRILAGLDTASGGEIRHKMDYEKSEISFVFQNFGILPWLTVSQNICLNLIGDKMPVKKQSKLLKEYLEIFGLENFKYHYPHELSGGMKQRVGLARAFINKPKVIFLDEPFSELDFFTATELRDVLTKMWEISKTTVVMVSHYVDEAVSLADRIVVFSDRPANINGIVKNDLSRPRNHRSHEFFAKEDEVLHLLKGKNSS